MKFFYLDANIHEEALYIIHAEGDAVVLYENEGSYHLMDTFAEVNL